MYSEADAEDRALRHGVEDVGHRDLALRIAAGLRAAKRDGPDCAELEPPGEWSDGQRDAHPDGACLDLAAHDNLPEPPKDAPVCARASSLPTPAVQVEPISRNSPATKVIPRRNGDPLIPDRRPIKAGGWGVSG
jgi:hypothetical protein